MVGELVGGRGDDRNPAFVGQVDRRPRGRCVVVAPQCGADHARAGMDRIGEAAGEAVGVDDEAVAHAHRQHAAARADPGVADAVVRLGGGGRGDAGPVAEVRVVAGVVVRALVAAVALVAAEEIVARDIVRVAVAVVVRAVGEGEDQVLRIETAVRVAVLDTCVRSVVPYVEQPVAVGVVAGGPQRER